MKNPGNFDFIIVDEAGQVCEPDALIPLARFLKQSTVVAIVGDTQQLGPTILSQDRTVRSIRGLVHGKTKFKPEFRSHIDQSQLAVQNTSIHCKLCTSTIL